MDNNTATATMSSKKRKESLSQEDVQKHIEGLRWRIQNNKWTEKQPVDEKDILRLSDSDYHRFLRARNYKQDDAFKMLSNYLIWRKDFNVGEIKREHIYDELCLRKTFFYNYDKEGRLVVYVRVGLHKSNDARLEGCKRTAIYLMEKACQAMAPDVQCITLIFDMNGFSMSNMDYKLTKFLIDMYGNYYPERLGKCLVVDSPWIFSPCFTLIKPWLDPVTAKKIMFVKKAQIKEHVDASVLLTICGGEDPWEFHQDMVTDEGGALLELHSNLLGQNKSTLDTITE